MSDFLDGIVAAMSAVGLSAKAVVIGSVTSFVGLRFFDGLSTRDRWTTFVGGVALAAWGTEPLADYLSLGAKSGVGVTLLLGLFGMSIAAAVVRVIKETDWVGIIKGFFGKGDKGGQK